MSANKTLSNIKSRKNSATTILKSSSVQLFQFFHRISHYLYKCSPTHWFDDMRNISINLDEPGDHQNKNHSTI